MPSKHKTGNSPEIKLIEVTILRLGKTTNKQTTEANKITCHFIANRPGENSHNLEYLFEFTYLIFLDV